MPGYFGRLPQARYNPNTSLFAGMSRDQVQAYLASCQQAYIELQSGQRSHLSAMRRGTAIVPSPTHRPMPPALPPSSNSCSSS